MRAHLGAEGVPEPRGGGGPRPGHHHAHHPPAVVRVQGQDVHLSCHHHEDITSFLYLYLIQSDHAAVHKAAGGGEGPHDPERGPGLVHAGPQQVQTITSTQTLHQQFKLCALAHSKLLLF